MSWAEEALNSLDESSYGSELRASDIVAASDQEFNEEMIQKYEKGIENPKMINLRRAMKLS